MSELLQPLLLGDRAALARAITLIESTRPDHRAEAEALLEAIAKTKLSTKRFGISGVPGVGKSTLIEALGMHAIAEGERVAVLAVDPSSSISGGSILGDKTRMPQLAQSAHAFIRPSPSALHLGGVTTHTREAVALVEAAGFTTVIIETVGVGQSEIEVADMVDMFILLLLPGSGDELQGIKKGIVELSDLLAITKADGDLLPQAKRVEADYTAALRLLPPRGHGQSPKAITVSAMSGEGIATMWQEMQAFIVSTQGNGWFEFNRTQQNVAAMHTQFQSLLLQTLEQSEAFIQERNRIEASVKEGTLSATAGARALVSFLGIARNV
jgi:LAO/AO transport system kinase